MNGQEFKRYEFVIEFAVSTPEKSQVEMLKILENELKEGIDRFCKGQNMARSIVRTTVLKEPE